MGSGPHLPSDLVTFGLPNIPNTTPKVYILGIWFFFTGINSSLKNPFKGDGTPDCFTSFSPRFPGIFPLTPPQGPGVSVPPPATLFTKGGETPFYFPNGVSFLGRIPSRVFYFSGVGPFFPNCFFFYPKWGVYIFFTFG